MTTRLLVLTVFAACTRGVPPVPPAPPPPAPAAITSVAAIAETFVVDSKILGERRVINVYVPPEYASSAARYPVLYVLRPSTATQSHAASWCSKALATARSVIVVRALPTVSSIGSRARSRSPIRPA